MAASPPVTGQSAWAGSLGPLCRVFGHPCPSPVAGEQRPGDVRPWPRRGGGKVGGRPPGSGAAGGKPRAATATHAATAHAATLGATRAHFTAGPAVAPEANGWVPNPPASAAKTRQVRHPPSREVEKLPVNEPRPGLTLQLEDALGLAGLATQEPSPSSRPPFAFPPLGPRQPRASSPGAQSTGSGHREA